MKALTIWQPWASLIMVRAKPHEFRGRSYCDYIGPPAVGDTVVIHAGARKIRQTEVLDQLNRLGGTDDATGLIADLARPLLRRVLDAPKGAPILPLGCALGTAVIGEPVRSCDLFRIAVSDSDRGQFNFAWPFTDVRPFVRPVDMRGAQGFFDVPDSFVQEALAA